ncbi:MAG: hypothetical protein COV30_01655 [Candidatus Yanofskybacteria bacterium CG10_big_fil_rev_8_21_14_0_10_37_15]|uniref:Outer membrane protein beta-barrel domain-containing protein n=1 Tax=Candidatus Yanofskybacteria bacterium CG10_big_fil_rev_8_21_14_0_10_37_15 TaxID=1975097 RepID=A0A2H0R5U1_9BACT|nr:MAG: hypothetical protein COV30_01655 [Candidatus Yanofskybacteria bacterium CG10_big_fil_rev_8_21_14_0_10_37_15]
MLNKKISFCFFSLILLLLAGTSIQGQQQEEKNKKKNIHYILTSGFHNKYLGNDGAVFHDKPLLQTDFFIEFPKIFDGCFIDIWISFGLDGTDFSSDFGDEVDVTGGCRKEISFGFKFNGEVSWYDIFPVFSLKNGDVIKLKARISRPLHIRGEGFVLYFSDEIYLISKQTEHLKGGAIIRSGIDWNKKIKNRVYVETGMEIFYDNGAFLFDNGWFSKSQLGFGGIAGPLKFGPKLVTIIPLTEVNDNRKTEIALSFGVSVIF